MKPNHKRNLCIGLIVAATSLLVSGCNIARRPDPLIQPSFSHLDQSSQPTFAIAAVPEQ